MRITEFLTDKVGIETGTGSAPYLAIHPEGTWRGCDVTLYLNQNATADEKLAIADRVLAGVQKWRDTVAAYADQQRTAVDELAAAREEIARLKADTEAVA
jgi:ferredoxin-NADP reductase